MSKHKKVTVEKDGEQIEVLPSQLKGLEKRGWTVVEDGSSESGQESAPVENGPHEVTLPANHEEY